MATASAAEKTYRYFRFETMRVWNGNPNMQMAEFTFSHNGTVLNSNNRNGSGVGVLPVTITSGDQNPTENEGPTKVGDGNLGTKWFKGTPFGEGQALTFDFGSAVTIDAYNWGSANDSVGYSRNPVSWNFAGSADGTTWDLLDSRVNYPILNQNLTYQAGFSIPAEILPAILYFDVYNTGSEGTAGIVLNGSPVSFLWETQYADDVSISPAPGDVETVGFVDDIIPPANATTTYTITAGRTGIVDTATSSLAFRSVVGGEATYRYVRFKATKLRSGLATGLVQLGEFSFANDATPVTVSAAENPGGNSWPDETQANLIDGDAIGNKWLDFNNAPVIFDFGSSKTFDAYSFYTANDGADRDPIQWTLEGSDDKLSWTLIENVNFDHPTSADRFRFSHDIPLPGASLSPFVNTFVGSSEILVEGQPFTLSWNVVAAASVSINQGVGAVSATDGSVPVTPPPGSTTYTLTATSAAGSVTTDTFTVNVISPPATNTINYADFSGVGDELSLKGSTGIFDGNVLRLTEDIGGQKGEAWFRFKQPVSTGFEATFKMSMNQDSPNGFAPADGLAFVIQNSAAGTDASGNGEAGLPVNALNIKFKSFGFDAANASQIQVLAGTNPLRTVSAYNTPGVVLKGLPDFPGTVAVDAFPFTFGTAAGEKPYEVRIVYVPGSPGHIDVYFEGIAVMQDVEVDLGEIGAVDGTGQAFVGFTARTGGNVQNSDIIDWRMSYGDFSALPPFGLVAAIAHPVAGAPVFNLVWNAEEDVSYTVESSPDLSPGMWTPVSSFGPQAGQFGVRMPATEGKYFYRVVENQ
ncbi:hypothetical protein [Luteolibacter sp. Populi]|uniref:lectin-like domain-containing protein n=1 Tax=Luteolibacter sp. Populi TaxID=3230487 RepID=UPI003467D359